MRQYYNFDVFIGYSSQDREAVRDLVLRLKADGLHVWFDEFEVKPNDSDMEKKLELGLEQSRVMILAMSNSVFGPEWLTLERYTLLFRDPTNQHRRFIPLRLDDVEIKDSLRQFAYIDWRQKSKEQYSLLLKACRPKKKRAGRQGVRDIDVQAKILKGNTFSTRGIAITPDSQRLVSGFSDMALRVWELNSGKYLISLKGHKNSIYGVAVTPDGRHVVSGSYDNTVRVWDLDSGDCLRVFEGHTAGIHSLAVTPDSRQVISASLDQTLRLWDIASGDCLAVLKENSGSINSVILTPDGERVITGSHHGTIRVWKSDFKGLLGALDGHRASVHGLALTPDGQRLVSGSHDRTIRVWELNSGNALRLSKDIPAA